MPPLGRTKNRRRHRLEDFGESMIVRKVGLFVGVDRYNSTKQGCAKPPRFSCKLLELLRLDFWDQSLRSPLVVSMLMTLLSVWGDNVIGYPHRVVFCRS